MIKRSTDSTIDAGSGDSFLYVGSEHEAAVMSTLRAGGMKVDEIADRLGISSRTVYRRLGQH